MPLPPSVASDSFRLSCIKAFGPFIIIFYAERDIGNCFYPSTCEYPGFVAPLLKRMYIFQHMFLVSLSKKSAGGSCVGLYLGSLSVPLLYISDFVPVPFCLS